MTLSGAPATGDTFAVAPSTNQSMFTTVQNLVNALQQAPSASSGSTQLNNSIANAIDNIDQALDQMQTVQASVGARLNTITTQQSAATTQQTQLQQTISTLQSLDYPQAITTLDFAEHDAERGDAGLYPHRRIVSVQVSLLTRGCF